MVWNPENHFHQHLVRGLLLALLLSVPMLTLTGCASRSPEPRYYLLTGPEEKPAGTSEKANRLVLGLETLEIADYLDRPQIAVRETDGRIRFSDGQRWASGFRASASRILRTTLSESLDTNLILKYPWRKSAGVDYRLQVDLERLDGKPGDTARLLASWWLFDEASGNLLVARETRLETPVNGPEMGDLIRAESALLVELGETIALAVSDSRAATPESLAPDS